MVPNAKLGNTSSDHLHAQHFPIQSSAVRFLYCSLFITLLFFMWFYTACFTKAQTVWHPGHNFP